MADNTNVILNNYSDDSQIKRYIQNVLMPNVFHDIPMNVLNTGFYSIVSEYMSQALENLAFTSSFYLNESFITKAMLPDSIYSEAAIFNIGYSFATPSVCNFMIELKIDDLMKNAKENPNYNGVYEFILDKNTKINLDNGSVYSLDYDVLIQYTNKDNPIWNVQYTNMEEQNSIAINKKPYILYRTGNPWLCIFVKMSEIQRHEYTVINNVSNGIPNEDFVITLSDHIAGFDIKYIDGSGNEQYLDKDHILPIHSDVKDQGPYVHYIMDAPQTIRFKFQMNGNRFFVPQMNSSFQITMYTCHGEAANFTAFRNDKSVSIITSATKYSNNGNVQKTAFVISGSAGGTNIGTVETTRRETIQAYNTANVISSDHDIYEWFKTFFFKRILYPFFFKRRDDPWGRIWSGFLALTDLNGDVFRTNTLHGEIPYRILYANNDNIISKNEIIIPPGWAWVYSNADANRCTVHPLVMTSSEQVEAANTSVADEEDFLFANPFGIRIQKDPFAIGYFNPWISESITTSLVTSPFTYQNTALGEYDESIIYHGTPSFVYIERTYQDDYYKLDTVIIPNQAMASNNQFVQYFRNNAAVPTFTEEMWNYFVKPLDVYSKSIPILVKNKENQYLPFNPETTYLCVNEKTRVSEDRWNLNGLWIEDQSSGISQNIPLSMTGFSAIFGTDEMWGDDGLWNGYEVKVTGDTDITMYPALESDSPITFNRVAAQNYYEMRLKDTEVLGRIVSIITPNVYETSLTKYGETKLWRIGQAYTSVIINILWNDGTTGSYTIQNAANIYTPYQPILLPDNQWKIELNEVNPNGIILYADMRPSPSSGAIDHYRIPLSLVEKNTALFYLESSQLPLDENNLRVVLEAYVNGVSMGYVEMQPVTLESDGSIRFDTVMYPLNKMVDVDNRIRIASTTHGGGSWIPTLESGIVSVDASDPEFVIHILFKSSDENLQSPVHDDPEYTGYRLQDRWNIDQFSLIQELKEMRSVVNFGEYVEPTEDQVTAYNLLIGYSLYNPNEGNLYTIKEYAHSMDIHETPVYDYHGTIQPAASAMVQNLNTVIETYSQSTSVPDLDTEYMQNLIGLLTRIVETPYESNIDWQEVYTVTANYPVEINEIFKDTGVNSGITIQLMPMVQAALMTSDSFSDFVSAFTQVHKAIEPVIFQRLEGNNYLDCKLIATYGLPHSYTADVNKDTDPPVFWPDLNVQIEFDVKMYNPALSTNTLSELRTIIKSYFNRITTVHTALDKISMDQNIYISQLIQLMEEHPNIAYLKFKGWYTDDKNVENGKYMNADYQAIVQKWDKLEDMPTKELENYVPEMFVLDDANIILNIL